MERLVPDLRSILYLHLAHAIAKKWSDQELTHFAVYTLFFQYLEKEDVFDRDLEWLNLPKRLGGLGADDEKDNEHNQNS